MASYQQPFNSHSNRRQQKDITFISNNDKVYGELLQGGIEAWTVERSICEDGFTYDFAMSLEDSSFRVDSNIICWTKRRNSKADNAVALNPSNRYPRMVLVRSVSTSTNDTRRNFATRFVQVQFCVTQCYSHCSAVLTLLQGAQFNPQGEGLEGEALHCDTAV
jgi:hypothetical protein